MISINKKIIALCDERGWTLYELSNRACLTQSTLSSSINRDTPPKIETLKSICDAFGITLSQFFQEDEQAEILTKAEKELIYVFRTMPEEKKKAIIDLLKN